MKFRLRTKPAEPQTAIRFSPAKVSVQMRPMRILDFDVEARPLHWISGDFVSKEITAIAWAWVDQPDAVSCVLLGELQPVDMLAQFLSAYRQADMVTGHYIRGYDLPMINGALTEYRSRAAARVEQLARESRRDAAAQSPQSEDGSSEVACGQSARAGGVDAHARASDGRRAAAH